MFFVSCIFITCISIYSYICEIFVNFFTYVHIDILHIYILCNIFHNCALLDVGSAIVALLYVISLVVAVTVPVVEDNEPNNIEFVLIDIHCAFIETFFVILYDKWYFALFFVSYISLTCIDIYLYILVCYQSNFWQKYWVSDILHDIAVVYCWSTSVCQVALSSDVLDNFFLISTGTCNTSLSASIVHSDDVYTEMLHVTVLWYCTEILLYMF